MCVYVFTNVYAYSFFLLCLFIMQMFFRCTKFFTCGIRYCLEIPPSHSVLELQYFNNWGIVFWLMDSMNAFSFFQTCQVQKKKYFFLLSLSSPVCCSRKYVLACEYILQILHVFWNHGRFRQTHCQSLNYSLMNLVEVFLLSSARIEGACCYFQVKIGVLSFGI